MFVPSILNCSLKSLEHHVLALILLINYLLDTIASIIPDHSAGDPRYQSNCIVVFYMFSFFILWWLGLQNKNVLNNCISHSLRDAGFSYFKTIYRRKLTLANKKQLTSQHAGPACFSCFASVLAGWMSFLC